MEMSAAAIVGAGLLTFLSPCVLPVVPVWLTLLGGDAGAGEDVRPSRFRAVVATLLFSAGFTLVFAVLGLSATVLGRFLAQNRILFQQIGGLIVILLGLRFVGWLKIPWLEGLGGGSTTRFRTRFHLVNAFVLGILFAFGWTPCVGSILGAVLTYASLATTNPLEGMGLLALYGAGFAIPLVVLAAFAGPAMVALRKARRFLPVFEKATGALLVVVGFLLASDRLGLVNFALSQPPEVPVEQVFAVPAPGTAPAPNADAAATCGGGAAADGTGAAQCGLGDLEPLPTMVEFHSPNCPVCLQMIPIVKSLETECRSHKVRIVQVDVSTPEGRRQALDAGVSGIPVFLFRDAAGREVARLVGYQKIDALEQVLSVLTGRECAGYRPFPTP
jgi:cytochrome c-type biogenesis protein